MVGQVRRDVQRLEAVRAAFRFTKRSLAAKLGVSSALLTEIGSARRDTGVSWRLAGLMQEKLGISANWVLTGTGRPLVSEAESYPPGVAELLENFVKEEREFSGNSRMLPVSVAPIQNDEIRHIHMYPSGRFVCDEMWTASRYFLRVMPGVSVPPNIMPGDYLLIESELGSWPGESEPSLFLVKESDEESLQLLRATLIKPGIIRGRPAALKPYLSFGKNETITAAAGPSGEAKEYELLGIALMLERDYPGIA